LRDMLGICLENLHLCCINAASVLGPVQSPLF